MPVPCDNCENTEFCLSMERCLAASLYNAFGDGDANDAMDLLTADEHSGPIAMAMEKNIFKKKITPVESDFIKEMLR